MQQVFTRKLELRPFAQYLLITATNEGVEAVALKNGKKSASPLAMVIARYVSITFPTCLLMLNRIPLCHRIIEEYVEPFESAGGKAVAWNELIDLAKPYVSSMMEKLAIPLDISRLAWQQVREKNPKIVEHTMAVNVWGNLDRVCAIPLKSSRGMCGHSFPSS